MLEIVEDLLASNSDIRFALKMSKLTLGIIAILHLMSCGIHWVTSPTGDSWVRGYFGDDYDNSENIDKWPLGPRYLVAFYWSTMTLSTVGCVPSYREEIFVMLSELIRLLAHCTGMVMYRSPRMGSVAWHYSE